MPGRTVFIHIPKCGGNSIEAKLRFNKIPFSRIEPDTEAENMPCTKLITGHIFYDQFVGESDTRFFSVMRSPLSRAISHYYYNLKIKDESPEYDRMKELGFEGFILEHTNPMCRQMFGNHIFDNNYSDERKYDLCRAIMKKQYLFIGTIHNLHYMDEWMLRRFGCLPHNAHENRNEKEYGKIVTARLHTMFMKRNMVDYMIYEYVANCWENDELKNYETQPEAISHDYVENKQETAI